MSSPVNLYSFAAALGLCIVWSVSDSSQVTPASDIHRVDFRNFRYYPTCLNWEEPGKVAVKAINGSYSKKDPDDEVHFEVKDIVYGDLNGDGTDEAAVLTNCNTGGTGWFDDGFLYAMQNGKPVMLSHIQGGDRASGGIRAVRIENGLLKVERLGSRLGSAIGAEFIDTTSYRLSGKKLLQAGRPVRRSLRGERTAKHIQFERGETSAMLTGTTSGADFYVLRAVGNHTMTVKITSKQDNARFELVVDDYTMVYRATEWSGKIDGRADYYIVVVSNKGSTDYSFEVTVR